MRRGMLERMWDARPSASASPAKMKTFFLTHTLMRFTRVSCRWCSSKCINPMLNVTQRLFLGCAFVNETMMKRSTGSSLERNGVM